MSQRRTTQQRSVPPRSEQQRSEQQGKTQQRTTQQPPVEIVEIDKETAKKRVFRYEQKHGFAKYDSNTIHVRRTNLSKGKVMSFIDSFIRDCRKAFPSVNFDAKYEYHHIQQKEKGKEKEPGSPFIDEWRGNLYFTDSRLYFLMAGLTIDGKVREERISSMDYDVEQMFKSVPSFSFEEGKKSSWGEEVEENPDLTEEDYRTLVPLTKVYNEETRESVEVRIERAAVKAPDADEEGNVIVAYTPVPFQELTEDMFLGLFANYRPQKVNIDSYAKPDGKVMSVITITFPFEANIGQFALIMHKVVPFVSKKLGEIKIIFNLRKRRPGSPRSNLPRAGPPSEERTERRYSEREYSGSPRGDLPWAGHPRSGPPREGQTERKYPERGYPTKQRGGPPPQKKETSSIDEEGFTTERRRGEQRVPSAKPKQAPPGRPKGNVGGPGKGKKPNPYEMLEE